jgi:hypothetical protein
LALIMELFQFSDAVAATVNARGGLFLQAVAGCLDASARNGAGGRGFLAAAARKRGAARYARLSAQANVGIYQSMPDMV